MSGADKRGKMQKWSPLRRPPPMMGQEMERRVRKRTDQTGKEQDNELEWTRRRERKGRLGSRSGVERSHQPGADPAAAFPFLLADRLSEVGEVLVCIMHHLHLHNPSLSLLILHIFHQNTVDGTDSTSTSQHRTACPVRSTQQPHLHYVPRYTYCCMSCALVRVAPTCCSPSTFTPTDPAIPVSSSPSHLHPIPDFP